MRGTLSNQAQRVRPSAAASTLGLPTFRGRSSQSAGLTHRVHRSSCRPAALRCRRGHRVALVCRPLSSRPRHNACCLQALRHEAWGATSQSCGSVSLPADAAVQQRRSGSWRSAPGVRAPTRWAFAWGRAPRHAAAAVEGPAEVGPNGPYRSPLSMAASGASASRHKARQAKLGERPWAGQDCRLEPRRRCGSRPHPGL
jgi:hypothetical protein